MPPKMSLNFLEGINFSEFQFFSKINLHQYLGARVRLTTLFRIICTLKMHRKANFVPLRSRVYNRKLLN